MYKKGKKNFFFKTKNNKVWSIPNNKESLSVILEDLLIIVLNFNQKTPLNKLSNENNRKFRGLQSPLHGTFI